MVACVYHLTCVFDKRSSTTAHSFQLGVGGQVALASARIVMPTNTKVEDWSGYCVLMGVRKKHFGFPFKETLKELHIKHCLTTP